MRSLIKNVVLSGLCLALICSCGASKEALPERPAGSGPEFISNPKVVESGFVVKNEPLQITHSAEPWKINKLVVESDAEKHTRIVKLFHVPIQFDGWLVIDEVSHSFQKCSGAVAEPKFYLVDDLRGSTEMTPKKKYSLIHEKVFWVKVVFENQSLCSGVDIQFGVMFGE